MAMRQLKIAAKITNRDNAIDRYLSDISRTETISPEREAALARQIHKGGEEAEKSKKSLLRPTCALWSRWQSSIWAMACRWPTW